jgi:hypothetical protein
MGWIIRGLGLRQFHKFPNQYMLVGYELFWACVITT